MFVRKKKIVCPFESGSKQGAHIAFESLEPFLTSSVSPHVKPPGPFCFRSLVLAKQTSKVEKRERDRDKEREKPRNRLLLHRTH